MTQHRLRLFCRGRVIGMILALWLSVSFMASGTEETANMRERILQAAQDLARQPILRRAYSFDDIPPEYRDSRAQPALKERREKFALSMSDFFMANVLAERLPLMATVAHEIGDPKVKTWTLDQLAEMTTWRPLNRPGYTLLSPGLPPPPNFTDGSWLGTGLGVRAITETLDIMGIDVPEALRHKLHRLLEAEILSVQDDFRLKRAWYINSPESNQFVLPNTGVVLACLELGREKYESAYEFGVKNLLRATAAQGDDGAHCEGANYGPFTTTELLCVAAAMRAKGDNRLARTPYLIHFADWIGHLIQPGGYVVNFFDGSERTTKGTRLLNSLLLAALVNRQPEWCGVISREFPTLPSSALTCRYRAFASAQTETNLPPPWAAFTSSPLVTWRSSWERQADGVWVRGGSPKDSHDHRDRGHVNYIVDGQEVLIEAGSTDYATPDLHTHYGSGIGHNVLQIGDTGAGAQRKGAGASIAVRRLDKTGGDVTVDPSAEYDPALLQHWHRRVAWDGAGLRIEDDVVLTSGKQDRVLFRFHLADEKKVQTESGTTSKASVVAWAGGRIAFEADQALDISTTSLPHGISYTQKSTHTCILVRSMEPVSALRLKTTLRRDDFPTPGKTP